MTVLPLREVGVIIFQCDGSLSMKLPAVKMTKILLSIMFIASGKGEFALAVELIVDEVTYVMFAAQPF